MKTKIIPFDLETAKKIQAGEIEGKIVRKCNPKQVCEILEFNAKYQDKCNEKFLIVKIPAHDFEREKLWIYHQDGRAMHGSSYEEMWFDLVLEVPDNEPQFKPFDKVLVRDVCGDIYGQWNATYYSHYNDFENKHSCGGVLFDECLPYEGNEHLVGTTDNPKQK